MASIKFYVVGVGTEQKIFCDRAHVKKGEELEWDIDQDYPFAVDFGWDSPVEEDLGGGHKKTKEKMKAEKKQAGAAGYEIKNKKIKEDLGIFDSPQIYKYSIAVCIPGNPPEVILEDPQIIIDP